MEIRRAPGNQPGARARQKPAELMEGFTTDAIAVQLGCARRTVARQLALIRRILAAEST
jgi:DNA-binding CsgD family transcriptional regulator